MRAIRSKFAEIFESWGLELPPADVDARKPGYLRQDGGSGSVRYVFAREGDDVYLEFYSFHRIWGDTHARIYTDGRVEHLDVLATSYIVGQDDDTTARNQRKMEEHNEKLLAELEDAGLMSGGPVPNSFTINAYLTTQHEDSDQED